MPKARIHGVYTITAKRTEGGQRTYLITGWTEDGERIRKREDTEDAAKAYIAALQKADETIRHARNNGSKPIVTEGYTFTSQIITSKGRQDDIEAALRQFPRGADGLPDPRFLVNDCVALGMRSYNPTLPVAKLNDISPLYCAHLEWRGKRPSNDKQFLADVKGAKYWHGRLLRLCGNMKVAELAAAGELQSRIEQSGETPDVKAKITGNANAMLGWAALSNLEPNGKDPAPAHPRYIQTYTPWSCGCEREGEPHVFSRAEYQALLDQAWLKVAQVLRRKLNRMQRAKPKATRSHAARVILLIWCALRPSEIDAPGFRLEDDCTVAHVPPEHTKTGWRDVPIPPNAQGLLRILRDNGLLNFRRPSAGSMALLRAKAGFFVRPHLMRSYMSLATQRAYNSISNEEAEEWFRKQWPLRFGVYEQDSPRHTGGSFYATASQSIAATAIFMGNQPREVEKSYWGRVEIKDTPDFYQALPTPFYQTMNVSKIPMPFWFRSQHAEQRRQEQQSVEDLTAQLASQIALDREAGTGDEDLPAAA
jgi:hypothetical protein